MLNFGSQISLKVQFTVEYFFGKFPIIHTCNFHLTNFWKLIARILHVCGENAAIVNEIRINSLQLTSFLIKILFLRYVSFINCLR